MDGKTKNDEYVSSSHGQQKELQASIRFVWKIMIIDRSNLKTRFQFVSLTFPQIRFFSENPDFKIAFPQKKLLCICVNLATSSKL